MKVAIIYNKDLSGVINQFGMQNKEVYNPATVNKVAAALEQGGHNVEIIDGNMHVVERIQAFMPKVVEGEQMGMVFNMAYGIQGESRYTHIPSMLEMLGIPYVGSSPSGHALALDKVITKIIMQKHGISTPDFWVFSSADDDMSEVKYPVIVKPKMESVSFGLKVTYNENELREAVDFIIKEFQQQALAEQFIRGREFAVGLLGNNPVETFPVLEIDLENDPDAIQSVDDKRTSPRRKVCPADLPESLSQQMKEQSIAAFKALQLRDFSRVDIRMDENHNIYLLEINSMASLGSTGSYVHAASVAGYDYKALVNKMLDMAVVRYFANSTLLKNGDISTEKIPLPVRLRGFLRSRQENTEKLLERIVNINSYVRNVEGVNEISNILIRELTALGFAHEIIPQVEVGNIVYLSNCYGEEPNVLLLGNIDNNKKISELDYFRRSDQKIYGTGIWEHKGGLVVMIAALQALRFVRMLRKLKIGILLTTDYTLQGKFARPQVVRKSVNTGYVLGLHGGDLNGSIITSRSGAAYYKCEMNLVKTADSNNVSVATGIFTRLVNSWIDLSDSDEGVVISPAKMHINSNIVHSFAHGEVELSVRFNRQEQFQKIDQKIRKMIPKLKYKDLLHFQIEGGLRRPSMECTSEVDKVWNEIKNIAQRLDTRITKEHRWSSSDISFVEQNKGIIDGLGPLGFQHYKSQEYILKHSIIERASLLALLLNKLT